MPIGHEDAECRRHPLYTRCPTDIQEVCRHGTCQLDKVHGRHRQAGPIHHTPHLAIQLDVAQVVLGRLGLQRLLFVVVSQFLIPRMAEQGVVIEVDLRVERKDIATCCHCKRVDLGQRGVAADKRRIQPPYELRPRLGRGAAQAKTV